MTPIIKIDLTDEEYERLQEKAFSEKYPSIKEYIFKLLFNESPSYDYEKLLWQVKTGIEDMETGERFLISDLINEMVWTKIPLNVRKNLGRMVVYSVNNGTDFKNIVPDGKDSQGVQLYKKLD
ncbi:hypothetical protein KP77_04610 [Jeotgalibacillus alimentarius]|uniref:Uncharacterized protein n=1 Tax=Jeotgalibacillus alimentarius TaxID=135826 RepID=A0A0C2RTD4_9BACL|nr:DUF1413 domain-containing protein [Jeotgalibacillus alimentarius]KIL53485.1 hypothetical protein KP77_04610 [Jeotgalibacillus alimentarius]